MRIYSMLIESTGRCICLMINRRIRIILDAMPLEIYCMIRIILDAML